MSELVSLIEERIESFAPSHVPPFTAVQAAHRSRRRRQRVTAAALLALAGGCVFSALPRGAREAQLGSATITQTALSSDPSEAADEFAQLLRHQVQTTIGGTINGVSGSHQTTVQQDGPLLALQGGLTWSDGQGRVRIAATWIPRVERYTATSCPRSPYIHHCVELPASDGGRTVVYSQQGAGLAREATRVFPDGSTVSLFALAGIETPTAGRAPSAEYPNRPALPLNDQQLADLVAHLAVSTTAAPVSDPDLALHQCMAGQGATVVFTLTGWSADFPSASKTAEVRAACQASLRSKTSSHPTG